jgi:sugar phosphate isomerase/epimerase
MTRQNRRTFLATLGAAALGGTALGCVARASAAPRRTLSRIGLQLYTLRAEMGRDLPGTLARVAEIGYREVEFAGYFNRPPAEIRALLERNGLTSPSTHIPFGEIRGNWRKTLDEATAIGHRWVTIPWLAAEERRDLDGWKRVAELFNRAAGEAKAAGLRFAYHNHDFELARVGDTTGLDVLLANTDPALVDYELDLYWTVKAGADPVDYFTRYPKRFPMVHVKDSAGAPQHRMTEVGGGTIDFRRIFAAGDRGGIQHYFVEHDNPTNPMGSVRSSYAYLAKLEF